MYKSRLAKEIDEHIQSELNRVAKLKKAEIYKDVIHFSLYLNSFCLNLTFYNTIILLYYYIILFSKFLAGKNFPRLREKYLEFQSIRHRGEKKTRNRDQKLSECC